MAKYPATIQRNEQGKVCCVMIDNPARGGIPFSCDISDMSEVSGAIEELARMVALQPEDFYITDSAA